MPNDDPDKLKGPGGMTLRQIHEQVKRSAERDRQAQVTQNKPAQNGSASCKRLGPQTIEPFEMRGYSPNATCQPSGFTTGPNSSTS